MRWVLEQGVFGSGCDLGPAARQAGHRVSRWHDAWWDEGAPDWDGPVLFHGSLENADRARRSLGWRPGAFCDAAAFACTAWYPRARGWLLNADWRCVPASALVAAPPDLDPLFVRPDSPLKPFSGRVLPRAQLSLAALDHGYYYDDPQLPVIVAPARPVSAEWRYVVVDRQVVAGSAYQAAGRAALPDDPGGAPWRFAAEVALALDPPEAVYVLDVCESEGALRLLELNPFSGADLYAADPARVVAAVADWLERA